MPRKKIELSQKEIDLVLKARLCMDILLLKDSAWGTLCVVSRNMANEFDQSLRKLTPKLYPTGFEIEHHSGPLDKKFFKKLSEVLQKLIDKKSPALKIANWRAKRFMPTIESFIHYFETTK